MIAELGTFSEKNLNISLCFVLYVYRRLVTWHTLGNLEKDALISTMFQAGSHSNNDTIQVDLRKYQAMSYCAVIDLSLRFQPIKVLWSMCVVSVP